MDARITNLVLAISITASVVASLSAASEPNPDDKAFVTPFTGSFASKPPAEGDLKLVSWNIDRGYGFDRVLTTLGEKQPDLSLLQEVDLHDRRTKGRDIARDLAEKLGDNYAFGAEFQELSQSVNDQPAYHGQATLSRWPILKSRIMRFERQSSWWKPHDVIPNTAFFQRRLGGR